MGFSLPVHNDPDILLQPRYSYTCTCVPPEARCSRNPSMSLLGELPKKRLYSLLNCETLRYPTRMLAAPTSIIMDSISRRASCRRSTFWYRNGLIDVTALKCR